MSNTNQQIVVSTLKQHIANYIRIDNQVREINTKLLELKKQREIVEELVVETIQSNKLEKMNVCLPNGTLNYVEKETHTPLSANFVNRSILRYFTEFYGDSYTTTQAQQQTDKIMNYILSQRETNKTYHLKRTITKY